MKNLSILLYYSSLVALALVLWPATAFFVTPQQRITSTQLSAGDGRAANYTWHEEALELEVSVQVPKQTRAKDIQFKATSRSIDLRLKQGDATSSCILLDGARPVRGRINLDGTFWVISDDESDADEL